MDKKLKDKNQSQDELIEGNARHFTSLSTKLDTQFTDAVAQMDRKFTDKTDLHGSRLDELTFSSKSQNEQVTKEVYNLDKKFTAKETVQAEQIEEHHKLFTDLCTRLEAQTKSTGNELSDRISAESRHFTSVSDGLQRKFAAEMAATEKRAEDARVRGETLLAQKATATSQEQLTQYRQLADSVLELETKLTDTTDETERKLTRAMDAYGPQLTALTDQVQKVNEHFTDVCYGLDKTGAALAQTMAEKMENTRQQSVNASTGLDRKFSDLVTELRQAVAEKNAAQDSRTDEVNRSVQQHYEHFTDLTSKLAKRNAEKDTEQDRLIEANRVQASEALANLHKRMKEDNDRVMDVVVKDYEVVTERTAELDRAANERDAALDQKYSEAVRSLDAKLSSVEQQQNERAANEHTHFTNSIQSLEQQIDATAFAQEKKAMELNAETVSRFSQLSADLGDRVDNEHRHFAALTSTMMNERVEGDAALDAKFAEICSKLDRKFTDSCEVIDERVQHNFKELSSMCGVLDHACVQKNDETAAAVSQSMASLEKVLARKNEEQDRALVNTERQCADSVAKVAASTTEAQNELKSQLADDREANLKQLTARASALDDRIEAEHKLFTDIIGKLDWKASEATANIDEKFTAACALLKKQTEEVDTKQTDAAELMSTQLATSSSDLRADIEKRHGDLMGNHEKLVTETQKASLTLAKSIDDTKSALDGDLRALEQKVEVEVGDKISTLDESVNRKLTDLKDMVEDKVQKSIDTMSTQLEAMNTRVKEMEPKLAETERVALSVQGKLETLETRVMLEQDELKTGMTKSLEGISTELDDLTSKVDEMTADLDINALLIGAATIKP